MMTEYGQLEKIADGSLDAKLKDFSALFAEGLFVYSHSSRQRSSLPSVRAQLALIAGEMIDEKSVQVALLQRARDLTSES